MIVRAFILLVFGLMFWLALAAKRALIEAANPARVKCQYDPVQDCTCAGVVGEQVYGCECCAASPCRPKADLKLEKVLKAESETAKRERDVKKELRRENADEH